MQSTVVLKYKKRNDNKICNLSAKLINSYSEIDEAIKSMHQSITIKIKNYDGEDWVVEKIVMHGVKIF